MKNYLEHELYNRIYLTKKFPRDVINEMINEGKINHPKQAWKTLGLKNKKLKKSKSQLQK